MSLLSSLSIVGNIIGSGTALTNLNYGSITNPPNLTVYDGWTKSGNNLYQTNYLSGNIAIWTNNPVFQTYIHSPTYSKPLLVLNAGTDPGGGTGRAIGQPLLGIGYNGFVGVGGYYGIGLGYLLAQLIKKVLCYNKYSRRGMWRFTIINKNLN